MTSRGCPIVLVAEDDPGDRVRLQNAFEATGLSSSVQFVGSTEELLGYLHHAPPWVAAETPGLILLNLAIGRDVLTLIKRDPELRRIPVIVLTNPQAHEDFMDAYGCGANTSIPKPQSADGLTNTVGVLGDFWLRVCTLPGARPADEIRDN